jgi:hypothetical protein
LIQDLNESVKAKPVSLKCCVSPVMLRIDFKRPA